MSKQLATAQRDIPVDLDVSSYVSATPDRSRLREVFREFELRDPLRRLEEALGSADAAAPAPDGRAGAERRSSASGYRSTRPAACPTARWRVAVRAPETPEGALFGERAGLALRRLPRRLRAAARRRCRAARGPRARDRRAPGRRPRRQGARAWCPRALAHDTEVAAYLLEPARARVPVPRARARSAGWPPEIEDEAGRDARLVAALADWQREEIRGRGLTDLLQTVELPIVRILRDMELAGVKLDTERAARASPSGSRPRPTRSSARSTSWPGRSSRSARPSSSRRCCSASSACRASGAARPATRPTPACCRRSATSIRSFPRSSAGGS